MDEKTKKLIYLAKKEGWDVTHSTIKDKHGAIKDNYTILNDYGAHSLKHPYVIYKKVYRDNADPSVKLKAMIKVHHYLWPKQVKTWHYWTEERFAAHCQGYRVISMAGGAGVAKSSDAAKIALIFWISDPFNNGCIVASTTLDSLENRIWGYVMKHLEEIKKSGIPVPAKPLASKPPKVIRPGQREKIHGLFAIPIKQGTTDATIGSLIGRHPNKRFLAFLDEATDMSSAIVKAFPNWEEGVEWFQVWAIGNSNSKHDLHGALSTPKHGWDSISIDRDTMWETTAQNGICLYNNPYNSPAIQETDPVKKGLLGKFLPTISKLKQKETDYGKNSDSYYRFCLGFWKDGAMEDKVVSEHFMREHNAYLPVTWSGLYPLKIVAGLDPAFAAGGTGCILRFAYMGHAIDGNMVLDYRHDEMLYRIDILRNHTKSGELQVTEQVIHLLRKHGCPLSSMAMDVTGAGRALGELIRIVSGSSQSCHKIVSVNTKNAKNALNNDSIDPFLYTASPTNLWLKLREFLNYDQIKGLDDVTLKQLSARLLIKKPDGKQVLEKKSDYKDRMLAIDASLAHSPDEADAAILALHAAILSHGFFPGYKRAMIDPTNAASISKVEHHIAKLDAEEQNLLNTPERKALEAVFLKPLEDFV